jgi:hypothetical protein
VVGPDGRTDIKSNQLRRNNDPRGIKLLIEKKNHLPGCSCQDKSDHQSRMTVGPMGGWTDVKSNQLSNNDPRDRQMCSRVTK